MERRDLIINSATKVIAREGYSNTKVQTVADEAGVAVGTIYHYFKSKQEILEYIYVSQCDKFVVHVDNLQKEEMSEVEKLEEFINYVMKEMEYNPDVLKVMIQIYQPEINSDLVIKAALDKLISKLAQLIQQGKELGEFADLEAYAYASILIHMIKGALNAFTSKKTNYESRKRQLVEFIIKGIKN